MAQFLKFRLYLTLFFVSGYLIVNAAFMLLRIPPVGLGVPVSEIILGIFILSIGLDLKYFKAFRQSTPFLAVVTWFSLGFVHLVIAAPSGGVWSIRDGAHWIQSNYFWVGFVLASRPDFFKIFEPWFRRTMDIAVFYFLLYPFRHIIEPFIPRIPSLTSYSTPIVFSYDNSNALATVGGFFRLLIARYSHESFLGTKLFFASVSLVFLILFLQVRVTYLQLAAVVILLVFIRPSALSKLGIIGMLGVIMAALALALDLNMPGRLGKEFSVDFLLNHIQAIWGGGDESVRNAAEGVDLRLHWWIKVIEDVNAHWWNSLFGLGFGQPLTDFHGRGGNVVREVHNSFVSVYGRLGPFGLICFITFHVAFFSTAAKLIMRFKSNNQWRLVVLVGGMLGMMTMEIIFSIVEGGFEVTYVAVPYYFMGGVIMALNRRVKVGDADLKASPA